MTDAQSYSERDKAGQRKRLKQILLEKSYLRNGPYTLSSGEKSDVFFDVKMTSLDPEGANLAADLILDMIEDRKIDAVGGLAIGACPIVSAICVKSFERGIKLTTFYVRKEKKDHGTQKQLEGVEKLKPGSRIVIVDDVATKGGSMLDAIKPVLEECPDCTIVDTVVVVDREQGATERLQENGGYTLSSIFKRSELEAE